MDLQPTIVTTDPTALEQITKGEVEIQCEMARRFPRRAALSLQRAEAMATQTPEIAAACFYALPRGGKTIEGPSVRLAEILAATWGNLRAGARVVEIGEKWVTAQGVAWDLETNTWFTSETRRRITGKTGKRFNDDMIGVTANAACAIAYREAVFRVIGKIQVERLWQKCREVAVGSSRSMTDSWAACVAYWAKAGVDEPALLRALKKEHSEAVTFEDIATLRGFATAVRDGDTTIDQCFPPLGETIKRVGPPPKTIERKPAPEESEPEPDVSRETSAPAADYSGVGPPEWGFEVDENGE